VNVKKDGPANSFARVVGELRKGACVSELSGGLAELVQAVQRTGKPGVLTLKIGVRPNKDGESVSLVDDWSVKSPRLERPSTSFFASEEGSLSRSNPRQTEMISVVEGAEQAEEAAAPEFKRAVNG
jgi:hypothetical protein